METLLPLVAFVVVSVCTPGPNNLLVLASGANWGLARTLPHVMGTVLGLPVMVVAVGLGVSVVFAALPWFHVLLQYVGFAYLCWLAWRIATATRPGGRAGIARPLSLWQAAAFQWVNPKAWTLILSGVAVFINPGTDRILQILVIASLFAIVALPNCLAWAVFGRAIAGFLADDRRRRWFNVGMALLLVASVLPALT